MNTRHYRPSYNTKNGDCDNILWIAMLIRRPNFNFNFKYGSIPRGTSVVHGVIKIKMWMGKNFHPVQSTGKKKNGNHSSTTAFTSMPNISFICFARFRRCFFVSPPRSSFTLCSSCWNDVHHGDAISRCRATVFLVCTSSCSSSSTYGFHVNNVHRC